MRLVVLACVVACGAEPTGVPQPIARTADAGVQAPADAALLKLTGVLTAAESVDVSPRIAGMIAKVYFGPGDKVAADQLVVDMDPQQMREELRAAEAAYAATAAAARQANVDVEDARRKLALETKAVAQGISASSLLDEARLGVKRAEAAYERVRSTQAAEGARAQTARDHVSNTGLRAPFAGTVAMRYRDAGNRVEAGAPILRIVRHGKMQLHFAVPVALASRIPIDSKVTASVDTIPGTLIATVKNVPPSIDPASGMILVVAELDDSKQDLRAGLAAWVDMPK